MFLWASERRISMATTTPTAPLSTVIGVFPGYDQANQAIDQLRQARFSYGRIRLVERGTGGFLDTLKGLFSGQTSTASVAPSSLEKMGMPEHDAQYYQRELDADHVLILMNADERAEEAFRVMRQCGAFDISAHLREASMASSDGSAATNTRTATNANARAATGNPNVPPATNTNAPAGAPNSAMPPAPDLNAPNGTFTPNTQPTFDPNAPTGANVPVQSPNNS
jgi:hypothetical protein